MKLKDNHHLTAHIFTHRKICLVSASALLTCGLIFWGNICFNLHCIISRCKGINRDERICDLCSLNTVETEIHFLTECPTFNEERISFLNDLNTNHNLQRDKMEINLIKEIMLCEDLSILNTFGKYIRSCFDKRKDQINSKPNPTTV